MIENAKHSGKQLSVGEVARRAGVAVSALHFYEQKGLISSWRNSGNQRRYNAHVLRRVAVIKSAQKLGVSLEAIGRAFEALPRDKSPTKRDWQRMSRVWREELNQRIQQLELLRDNLDGCIGCGCLSLKTCPLYNPDDRAAASGTGAVHWSKTTRHTETT